MNKMVRQQLFVAAEQKRRLKTRAALTGMSEGEIIRRGIDHQLAQEAAAQEGGDRKEAWRQAFGMWEDRDDVDIDALIAATAEHHGLRLATLSVKHFPMFPRLRRVC